MVLRPRHFAELNKFIFDGFGKFNSIQGFVDKISTFIPFAVVTTTI